jgi:hypothetical protein
MRSIKFRLIERQRPAQFSEDCAGFAFSDLRGIKFASLVAPTVPG